MDVDYANCKLKISQCLEKQQNKKIERPLNLDFKVENLNHLIAELHKVFSSEYVNVEYVRSLMESYKSNEHDWKQFAKFDRFRYTRNLVNEGNGAFNLIILCWGPGHASAIHDHADSHCFMKMLKGTLEEVRFEWPKNDKGEEQKHDEDEPYDNMVEVKRTPLLVDEVCYINDTLGLHRMENPSNVSNAISLHLYCPPFNTCTIFEGRTGRSNKVTVNFYSKFGNRVKLGDGNQVSESQE